MEYNSTSFFNSRPSFKTTLRNFFKSKSALNRLIIINIAVYIAFFLFRILANTFVYLSGGNSSEIVIEKLIHLLACPASFDQLLIQPWSIISGIFFHTGFWHLFMNMLMLYVAGIIFKQYLDDKKLIITYFVGGICGNLLYMGAYNFFPVFAEALPMAYALGASGSIMAILVAITVYRPHHEVNILLIGRTKLLWITLVFVILDIFSIPQGNAGGHIAHLGGALYGALSVLFYTHITFPKFTKVKKKKTKFTTSYDNKWRPVSDEEFNTNRAKQQKRVDEILDKISKNGYDALSKEEKDFLFNFRK